MSSAADRQRRKRAREQRGEMLAPVLVNEGHRCTLMRMRLLDVNDQDDPARVAAAMVRLLELSEVQT